MIYITGDTHRDFTRFTTKRFPVQKKLTKNDYVIVCGDFGIWNDSREEHYWLDWLDKKPFTTLFVTGNHSNYDILKTLPVEEWKGGQVQRIRDAVIHLMRGQVFEIDGNCIFTMGGASSHDIDAGILEPDDPDLKEKRLWYDMRYALYRINHVSWWKEELPSDEEYEVALRNLDACGWKVDYVITHCCSTSIQNAVGGDTYVRDRLTDFFENISKRLNSNTGSLATTMTMSFFKRSMSCSTRRSSTRSKSTDCLKWWNNEDHLSGCGRCPQQPSIPLPNRS